MRSNVLHNQHKNYTTFSLFIILTCFDVTFVDLLQLYLNQYKRIDIDKTRDYIICELFKNSRPH